MENNVLQALAKIAEFNPDGLQIAMRVIPDDEFIARYGKEAHGRIDMVVPESVLKLFGDLTPHATPRGARRGVR